MDGLISHTKERDNVWVSQFFPLENCLDDEGLLDQLTGKAGLIQR